MNPFNIIPDHQRLDFLPRHFGRRMVQFEGTLYHMADNMLQGYTGGYWEYAEAKNGAPFAFLKTDKPITLANMFSGEQVEVDAVLAGMILSLYTLNYMLERAANGGLMDKYDALRDALYDYAKDKGMTEQAFTMLD